MWDLREQSSMTRSGDFKHCKRFKLFRPPRIVTIVEQTFLCQRQSGNEGISSVEEYFVINWISLNRNVSRQSVSPRQQRQDPGTQTPDSLQEDRRRGQQEDKRQVWSSRQVQVSQPELLQCPQQSQGLGNWSIYPQDCSGRQCGHSQPKVRNGLSSLGSLLLCLLTAVIPHSLLRIILFWSFITLTSRLLTFLLKWHRNQRESNFHQIWVNPLHFNFFTRKTPGYCLWQWPQLSVNLLWNFNKKIILLPLSTMLFYTVRRNL